MDKGGEHTTEDDGEHTTEDDGETDSCIGASPVIAGFGSRDEKEPKFKASLGCKVTRQPTFDLWTPPSKRKELTL